MRQSIGTPRSRQRGFGLIGMMALLAVLAAGATVIYLSGQVYWRQRATTDQVAALRWADSLLQSFVLRHGRLPCPATVQLGAEACADPGAQWLPLQTLLNQVPVATGTLTSSMQQVTYQPYRGDASQTSPDLTAQPGTQSGYVPTVGEIVASTSRHRNTAASSGIAGTQPALLAGYRPVPSSVDFCQALQNMALGPTVAGPLIDPWSTALAPNAATNAYKLSTGRSGAVREVSATQLSQVFQCEIMRASLDVMATTASLSVPPPRRSGESGGDVQAQLAGMLGHPIYEGSFPWVVNTLLPQILAADAVGQALGILQSNTVLAKVEGATTALAFLTVAPLAIVSLPVYSSALAEIAPDLILQSAGFINDGAYDALYQGLVSRVQGIQPWGRVGAGQDSQANRVVQQAVQLGLAAAVGPSVP